MSNIVLIISNANELVRVRPERIVYVESDGNYSTMVLHDKMEYVFTMNLAHCQQMMEEQFDLFPRLKERRNQLAGSLSGGEQQMLAIARGLMSDPKLIMFDEPSLGLAPVIVDDVFNVIVRINKEKNIPILLVEQNAFMALSISNRTYVLENGVITSSGKSSDLIESDEIRKAYLGG